MFSGCTGLKKITLHGMTIGYYNMIPASYFYWIGEGGSIASSVSDVGTLEVSSYSSFEISGFDTRKWLGLPDTWNVVQKDFNNNLDPESINLLKQFLDGNLYPSSVFENDIYNIDEKSVEKFLGKKRYTVFDISITFGKDEYFRV